MGVPVASGLLELRGIGLGLGAKKVRCERDPESAVDLIIRGMLT